MMKYRPPGISYPVSIPQHYHYPTNPYARMRGGGETRELHNTVRVVAGTSVALMGIGTLGALGLGFAGALRP